MRLWTSQPPEVYELLQTTGVYRCDITKSEYWSDERFMDAYNWMVDQMVYYLGPPSEYWTKRLGQYPIWAWHTYNWKHQQPDLRCKGLGNKGAKEVMLEIEIPDHLVLLSDHTKWHSVLNNGFLFESIDEPEFNQIYDWFDHLSNAQKSIITRASWQNIFMVYPYKHGDWATNGRYVQATFWELRKEQIINARVYKAR